MEKHLSPSILAADFAKLGEQIALVEHSQAEYLHIDVMDGVFVPSISFGMPLISSIRKVSKMIFDVHLMIVEPERYIEDFVKAGADMISVHVETIKSSKVFEQIRGLGVRPAIAYNPETDVKEIIPYLPYVDMVLCMSVHPGFGGQKYIEESDEKLRELVRLRNELGLNYIIEVDGGVNNDNATRIAQAGADLIVAGSAVFKGNIAQNANTLVELIRK